jgi:sugar O-acyltransferase (sialic acid O-acetyltransferase NeuD family)
MNKSFYAVYGASGFGREVLPIARSMLDESVISGNRLVFVDDSPLVHNLNGHDVLSYEDFLAIEATEKHVTLAISDNTIREKLANRLLEDMIQLWSISAKNIVIMDDVSIGEGYLLSHFVCLTSNIKIGRCFHANIYSYVAHDCIIGDFVTFAPNVHCNGNVVIEDHAYIGTGAVIKQGMPNNPLVIGEGAIVGMGAVVTTSVPAGTTVIGNPARALIKG